MIVHVMAQQNSSTNDSRNARHNNLMLVAMAVLLGLASQCWSYDLDQPHDEPDQPGVQTLPEPEAIPPFTLVDQHSRLFTQTQLIGKWTIMFFGFTHCPVFCPPTLAELNGAYHPVEQNAPKLDGSTQVVFVSLDPFRDPPAVLADFINNFNPHFIGTTGPPSQLHQLTDSLGERYSYADLVTGKPLGYTLKQPAQAYTVDHALGLYIFDDRARIVARIPPPITADRVVYQVNFIRNHFK
jgi:protein SCO1/2